MTNPMDVDYTIEDQLAQANDTIDDLEARIRTNEGDYQGTIAQMRNKIDAGVVDLGILQDAMETKEARIDALKAKLADRDTLIDQRRLDQEQAVEKLTKWVTQLVECLDALAWQFGFWVVNEYGGETEPPVQRLSLTTGGYRDLELAFELLGWEDPHFSDEVDGVACQWPGCVEHSTGGQPLSEAAIAATSWPEACLDRAKPYARICSQHMAAIQRADSEQSWMAAEADVD